MFDFFAIKGVKEDNNPNQADFLNHGKGEYVIFCFKYNIDNKEGNHKIRKVQEDGEDYNMQEEVVIIDERCQKLDTINKIDEQEYTKFTLHIADEHAFGDNNRFSKSIKKITFMEVYDIEIAKSIA